MLRMSFLMILLGAAAVTAAPAQTVKKKAGGPAAGQPIMTRPLADADVDLYCRIAAEIRKLTGPVRSGEDSDRMLEITRTTAPKHGLTHAEYRALDLRIGSALLALDAGPAKITAKNKADCELVARHRARIEEARKFPR